MAANDIRNGVLNLMNEKNKIEEEIKRMGAILAENGVGMNDPLVDNEGFPLADVDVYQVRHARQRIICLQNDHKAIMKRIESGLTSYYESNVNSPTSSSQEAEVTIADEIPDSPFTKITSVVPNSPADEAGLQVGDLILQFGSVNSRNFKDLSTIGNIVQHSQDTEIRVHIKRDGRKLLVKLRPHVWPGKGLLGCSIFPIDVLDR